MLQYETLEEALDAVYADAKAILVARQRKYGKSNISVFGEIGVLVRASDKFERLKNMLTLPPEMADCPDDSVDDAWFDIINYGMIALLVRRALWNLPLRENVNPHGHTDEMKRPLSAWATAALRKEE